MNSFERVKAALHFQNPDKVPVFNLVMGDILPLPVIHSRKWRPGWAENEHGLFPHVIRGYKWDRPDWAKKPEFEGDTWRTVPHEEVDEWGCIWNMSGREDNMGHPGRPVLADWDQLEQYKAQYKLKARDESRFILSRRLLESTKEGDKKYRLVIYSFGLFERACKIRGFNNCLIDQIRNPEKLKELLEFITDYHIQVIDTCIEYDLQPHGFMIAEDLGEQSRPLMSPKIFKKIYEPFYRRIFDRVHEYGCDYVIHSCGKMDALIPPLIEWGLDAIEFDSPRMCGYKDLQKFRGKIMIWGCVNIQSIYVNGTPEEVEREVWHMVRNLGTKHGGFGAYFYAEPKVLKTPLKNIRAFKKGLKKYGIYSQIPENWWDYPVEEEWNDNIVPPLPPSE